MFAKLIYSSIAVFLTSAILNYFCEKYFVGKPFVTFKLSFYADEDWTKECREYILEYLPDWINDSFTPKVAKCASICSEHGSNKYSVLFEPECRTYPVMAIDGDTDESRLKLMTNAEASVPCFLSLSQSKIPGANRGIFTKVKLPKGFLFGPYYGTIRSAYGEEGENAKNGGYAWRINREDENGEEDDIYIDGVSESDSNWLRYANSARFEEEQNLYVLMFNDTVYYITYKEVEPDTELLVWYGKSYAEWLTIETVENSGHDWESDFAPKKDIVICNSCPRSRPPSNESSEELEKPTVSVSVEEAEAEAELDESVTPEQILVDNDHVTNTLKKDIESPVAGTKENLEL